MREAKAACHSGCTYDKLLNSRRQGGLQMFLSSWTQGLMEMVKFAVEESGLASVVMCDPLASARHASETIAIIMRSQPRVFLPHVPYVRQRRHERPYDTCLVSKFMPYSSTSLANACVHVCVIPGIAARAHSRTLERGTLQRYYLWLLVLTKGSLQKTHLRPTLHGNTGPGCRSKWRTPMTQKRMRDLRA